MRKLFAYLKKNQAVELKSSLATSKVNYLMRRNFFALYSFSPDDPEKCPSKFGIVVVC
jgi:hypothetical protein